jgi:hypothetical protein
LLGELLLALEELVELELVEVLELPGEGAAVVHPLADGFLQGARDIQQGAAALVAAGQVQGAVELAPLTAAGGLAAGSGAFDQAAAQEGLLGDQLSESGTGVALGGGAVRTVAHGVSSVVLTQHYTLRTSGAHESSDECENAPPRPDLVKTRTEQRLSTDQRPTCGTAVGSGVGERGGTYRSVTRTTAEYGATA